MGHAHPPPLVHLLKNEYLYLPCDRTGPVDVMPIRHASGGGKLVAVGRLSSTSFSDELRQSPDIYRAVAKSGPETPQELLFWPPPGAIPPFLDNWYLPARGRFWSDPCWGLAFQLVAR